MTKEQRQEILRLGREYASVMEQGAGATFTHPCSPLLRACVYEAGTDSVRKWAMRNVTRPDDDRAAYCAILGACFTTMTLGGVGNALGEDV